MIGVAVGDVVEPLDWWVAVVVVVVFFEGDLEAGEIGFGPCIICLVSLVAKGKNEGESQKCQNTNYN